MAVIEHRPPLVYVVFVPKKGVMNRSELIKIQQEACSSHLNALFSSMDYKALDNALAHKMSLGDIIWIVHNCSFASIQRIWIAGAGSSVYAREVIRSAFSSEYNIPVSNYAPEGSSLYRYVKMLEGGKERAGCPVRQKPLLLSSR